MNIYIVVCEDRHSTPEIKVFDKEEIAVTYAKKLAKDYCDFPEDYKEETLEGYIYSASYSCEDDCVYVKKRILNDES